MRIFQVHAGLCSFLAVCLLAVTGCRDAVDTGGGLDPSRSDELGLRSSEDGDFVRVDPSLGARPGAGAAGGPSPVPQGPTLSHDAPEPGSPFDFGTSVYALPDQRILRLGATLEIIDIHEPSAPRVEGTLALDDYPVSLHVAGDRVIVLSNAKEYWGSRSDIDYAWGAYISSVDISDREHPKLLARISARGWLVAGILKNQGDDPLAVYLALSATEPSQAEDHGTGITAVASFSVARDSGDIALQTEHELPPLQVLRLQASGTRLIALGRQTVRGMTDPNEQLQFLEAHVFDVSNPDASLRALGQLRVAGAEVADRHALDVQGSVLRVISSGSSVYPMALAPVGADTEHHVETFNVAESGQLARIAHCSLQGTRLVDRSVFVSAGALIVGYANGGATGRIAQDVHAIAIDEQGQCRDVGSPQLQDVPSMLRETHGGSRLLTVSELRETNANTYTPQWRVALYDVTDLAAAKLLAETHVALNAQRYGEPASCDVFEAASQVTSADGTPETGLLLLAPSYYGRTAQLLTFSDRTLTARGSIEVATGESTLLLDPTTAAALTWSDLTLWSVGATQPPERLGTLSMPRWRTRFVYNLGDYRLHVQELQLSPFEFQLQVTQAPALDPSPVLSTVDLPKGPGTVERIGDFVLHLSQQDSGATAQSQLTVYDYSDPRQPRMRGELTTTGNAIPRALFALGSVSAFAEYTPRSQDLGVGMSCTTLPPVQSVGAENEPSYYWGNRICLSHASGEQECTGTLLLCERSTNHCTSLDTDPPGSRTECTELSETRTWSSTTVRPLDLRDPDAPRYLAPIAMPENSSADHVIAVDRKLYVSWYEQAKDAVEPSVLVREYVTEIDLADPDNVRVSEPVNIPGPVIAVQADTLITEAPAPRSSGITLARVSRDQGKARVERSVNLAAGRLSLVEHDSHGNLIIVTEPTDARNLALGAQESVMLHVIDPQELTVLGSMTIDRVARWIDAAGDRAALQVPGGVLIVDYSMATAPFAYSYLPGASSAVHFDGDYVYSSALPLDVRMRRHIQP